MSSNDFLYSLSSQGNYDKLITYIENHDDKHVRYGASGVLLESSNQFRMQANSEQVQRLIQITLTEPNHQIRAKVLEILVEIEGESALEDVIDRLGSSAYPTPTDTPYPRILTRWHSSQYYSLRLLSIIGFGTLSEESYNIKLKTSIQKESHPKVLRRAIEEGGKLRDETFVKPIQQYIYASDTEFQTTNQDEIKEIRKTAIEALVTIGSDAAYEALLTATRKQNKTLKKHALKKIGEFGVNQSLDVAVDELDAEDQEIRKSAAESVLNSFQTVEEDSHAVRMKALDQLTQDTDLNAADQFAEIVTEADEKPVQRNSAWLLGQLQDSKTNTITALLDAVDSEDPYLRKIAAASLYRLDENKVIPKIETKLQTLESDSEAYEVLSFINSRLKEDYKKEVVEYTYVSEPSDYSAN